MIALTTPPQINSVLGGNVPVGYDKFVISPFSMDAVGQTISGTVRMTVSSTPSMQPITGTMRISIPAAELVIEVPQLDFYRRIVLSGAQTTAVANWIETAQAQIENGLLSVAVVSGTRSAGA